MFKKLNVGTVPTFKKLNIGNLKKSLSSKKILLGHGPQGGADAPVERFCKKFQRKHQGSEKSEAVFWVALPLCCWAQLAKHPIFLNLIKKLRVYIQRGQRTHQGKLNTQGRHGCRGAGRRSGLRPYPSLGAARSFSIVAPSPRANRSYRKSSPLYLHPLSMLPSPFHNIFLKIIFLFLDFLRLTF